MEISDRQQRGPRVLKVVEPRKNSKPVTGDRHLAGQVFGIWKVVRYADRLPGNISIRAITTA